MRCRILLTAMILVMLAGSMMFASEAAVAPIWEVGDYWEYRDTRETEDDVAFYRTNLLLLGGIRYDIYAMTMRSAATGDDVGPLRFRVGRAPSLTETIWFPLWVGKHWTMTETGFYGEQTRIVTVLGFEPVETPAGMLSAFHIRVETHSDFPQAEVRVAEVWYSPQVENIVRKLAFRSGEIVRESILVGYGRRTPEDAIDEIFQQLEAALSDRKLFSDALSSLFILHQYGIEPGRAMEIIRASSPPPLP